MKDHLYFDIEINAPVEKVWATMLEQETYEEWTKPFSPDDSTSYFVGSWDKGSKIKFLSNNGDGMLSEIVENIPAKYISIKHLGEIHDGKEIIYPDPAYENYSFTDQDGITKLEVVMELEKSSELDKMKNMFEAMWPQALKILKEISEKKE